MNIEQYLSALCVKAGFDGDMWRDRVLNIDMFTAEVFSEREFTNGNN